MRILGSVFLALLIAASASAQEPETPVEGQHGAAYVSYGYTEGSAASLDHVQFDLDVALPGTVISLAGHFTDSGIHAGPKASYLVGPITLFGHHLFLARGNDSAAAAIGNKTGGGVEIPLPRGSVLRIGLNGHSSDDGAVDELTIGFGARF